MEIEWKSSGNVMASMNEREEFCKEWTEACNRLRHTKKAPASAGTWIWAGDNVERRTASGCVFKK